MGLNLDALVWRMLLTINRNHVLVTVCKCVTVISCEQCLTHGDKSNIWIQITDFLQNPGESKKISVRALLHGPSDQVCLSVFRADLIWPSSLPYVTADISDDISTAIHFCIHPALSNAPKISKANWWSSRVTFVMQGVWMELQTLWQGNHEDDHTVAI